MLFVVVVFYARHSAHHNKVVAHFRFSVYFFTTAAFALVSMVTKCRVVPFVVPDVSFGESSLL